MALLVPKTRPLISRSAAKAAKAISSANTVSVSICPNSAHLRAARNAATATWRAITVWPAVSKIRPVAIARFASSVSVSAAAATIAAAVLGRSARTSLAARAVVATINVRRTKRASTRAAKRVVASTRNVRWGRSARPTNASAAALAIVAAARATSAMAESVARDAGPPQPIVGPVRLVVLIRFAAKLAVPTVIARVGRSANPTRRRAAEAVAPDAVSTAIARRPPSRPTPIRFSLKAIAAQ